MEHLNKIILHYKLTRFIGEGGMASVYEGTHEKLGTKVAIKILSPILTANKQIRIRFENEAKFMASLDHPNITRVIDYEDQPDMLAIVMELLKGQDLSTLIKTEGALKPDQAIPIFTQILDAFQYAHSKGIVHRDIKPSNIFLDANNQVKILDFGIAKIFGSEDDFTSTGTQMGTPVYMSPEQVKADKSIDHRSDIYSLGVTLFFALNGKAPYDSTTQSNFEIFNKIVYEPIPDLVQYPEINQVIKQAIAKDRNQRFQQASEFKKALLSGNFKSSIIGDDKTLVYKQKHNENSFKVENIPIKTDATEGDNEKTLIQKSQNISTEKKPIITEQNKNIKVLDKKEPEKQNRNIIIGISALGVLVLMIILYFALRNTGSSAPELVEKSSLDSTPLTDSSAKVNHEQIIKNQDSSSLSGNKGIPDSVANTLANTTKEAKDISLSVYKTIKKIGAVDNVVYNKNGSLCAMFFEQNDFTGDQDYQIRIYQTNSYKEIASIKFDRDSYNPTILSFNSNSDKLLYTENKSLKIYNIKTGVSEEISNQIFYGGIFHPSKEDIAIVSTGTEVWIYNVNEAKVVSKTPYSNPNKYSGVNLGMDLTVTNSHMYIGHTYGKSIIQIGLSDLSVNQILLPLDKPETNPIAISPNEKYMAVTLSFDEIKVYDFENFRKTGNLKLVCSFKHANTVTSMKFTDDSYLVSGSVDRSVALWNVTTNKKLSQFKKSGYLSYVCDVDVDRLNRKILVGALYGVFYIFNY